VSLILVALLAAALLCFRMSRVNTLHVKFLQIQPEMDRQQVWQIMGGPPTQATVLSRVVQEEWLVEDNAEIVISDGSRDEVRAKHFLQGSHPTLWRRMRQALSQLLGL
jgi:hypothetical protein